ncbi:protein of unknown function [Verrucomicrobium sp. GAS474]|uniref:ImmA/IrrE family metallo-endopeptidase n=1 Tax=Verrucomicrobium sp. GAS474 TaxID=1882831 RepID=UPI00087A1DD1|nr:ImmA/IrrE family metallo-endopeptidase [Verrucomicrobium sp. GAS474]SDT85695.1 protein of unknown function [Verrucomicrobium sp. GAS474]SDU31721.1 protein of unknown function [Verrucomicrobium sp. GAS474]
MSEPSSPHPAITFLEVCQSVLEVLASIPNLQPPINIMGDVREAIEKRLSVGVAFKIHFEENTWTPEALIGMLLRYKDRARVIYPGINNGCWRRFIMAKELAHLIIDTDPSRFTTDPIRLVQELINKAPLQVDGSQPFESERYAIYVAYELMIPWQFNAECLARLAAGQTTLDLAKWLRVPQKAVEFVLSSDYQASRKKAYGQLSPMPL